MHGSDIAGIGLVIERRNYITVTVSVAISVSTPVRMSVCSLTYLKNHVCQEPVIKSN